MTSKLIFAAMMTLALVAAASGAEGTAIPKKMDLGRAPSIFKANCSACHDWAGSYDTIIETVIVPGKPGESPAWQMISQDIMPPTGPLGEDDKAVILAWIEAGAPRPAAGSGASASAAAPGAAATGASLTSARFLGFADKEAFHRFSGWTSGGILLAAAGVGTWHLVDMISMAHANRDRLGINDFDPLLCPPYVAEAYKDPREQALRWTHVGLLAAGESFYIANAITGTSFMGRLPPGWSKARIHRYAFFIHAGLMVAEGLLGYFSSDALQRGDHNAFTGLLIAHAGVGLAIPVVILGAGAIMDPKLKL